MKKLLIIFIFLFGNVKVSALCVFNPEVSVSVKNDLDNQSNFIFKIYNDSYSDILETNAKGNFKEIKLDEAGEYTYTIKQVYSDDNKYNYDDTLYKLYLYVYDDSNNCEMLIKKNDEYKVDSISFINSKIIKEEPVVPKEVVPDTPSKPKETIKTQKLPNTGRNNYIYIIIFGAGVLLLIIGLIIIKKDKHEK